jgi:hypothetical protein
VMKGSIARRVSAWPRSQSVILVQKTETVTTSGQVLKSTVTVTLPMGSSLTPKYVAIGAPIPASPSRAWGKFAAKSCPVNQRACGSAKPGTAMLLQVESEFAFLSLKSLRGTRTPHPAPLNREPSQPVVPIHDDPPLPFSHMRSSLHGELPQTLER